MLTLKNLSVSVENKEILKDINILVGSGEIHAIMGPNGSGKSSLGFAIAGKSNYELSFDSGRQTSLPQDRRITNHELNKETKQLKPQIILDGVNITNLSPDDRAKAGLFLAFQSPIAIPGVSVRKLLRSLITNYQLPLRQGSGQAITKQYQISNIKYKKNHKTTDSQLSTTSTISNVVETYKEIDRIAKALHIKKELLNRSLNDDFSGGEKKKLEMLQMLFIKPKYAIIDEIDTGLDVDALKIVANGIRKLSKEGTGFILITHYNRILKHIKPDKVHILMNGKIVRTGGAKLAKKIEEYGYSEFIENSEDRKLTV